MKHPGLDATELSHLTLERLEECFNKLIEYSVEPPYEVWTTAQEYKHLVKLAKTDGDNRELFASFKIKVDGKTMKNPFKEAAK